MGRIPSGGCVEGSTELGDRPKAASPDGPRGRTETKEELESPRTGAAG